ncbi:MBL fold metallo-hydrolase [Niabella ginsengisoli]|uniref:MBL fold metallo-hydrolase n=1 Tax=Niabella ginsengisoli TaxID=522298 RepID=A0ABS9SJD2_9BACT|nr:MBL fold metallo-hydrolase [Niabella ginsengisoli]MCH5598455.1 MBL fold metallo-hydrolase [Niabella ginsengisoli]
MIRRPIIFLLIILMSACNMQSGENDTMVSKKGVAANTVSLLVLGNVQDAGSPHIACTRDCCKELFTKPDPERKVVALGLLDKVNNKKYLFEATPDIVSQLKYLKLQLPDNTREMPDGIFLTHAHIGHYTGLMHLGKEATDAKEVPVYVMSRMDSFLRHNGPWSQLIERENIKLNQMQNRKETSLGESIKVTPLRVPHRDEYSETVGFIIAGPNKKALFIPDIDKWEKWDADIVALIAIVDYAFIDATFYSGAEIKRRDISLIPHPFAIETMKIMEHLSEKEKAKIRFIHFNHTNPLLKPDSKDTKEVLEKGFGIARFGDEVEL